MVIYLVKLFGMSVGGWEGEVELTSGVVEKASFD